VSEEVTLQLIKANAMMMAIKMALLWLKNSYETGENK